MKSHLIFDFINYQIKTIDYITNTDIKINREKREMRYAY